MDRSAKLADDCEPDVDGLLGWTKSGEVADAQAVCDGAWFAITGAEGYTCEQTNHKFKCEDAAGAEVDEIGDFLEEQACDGLTPADPVYNEDACDALYELHEADDDWPTEAQKLEWSYVSVCGGATSVTAFGAAIVAAIAALAF